MRSEQAAFVCSHVFQGTRPVLLVSRDGGDWQFLCGGLHSAEEVPHVIGLQHLIEADPALRGILDLPDGYEAERAAAGDAWLRRSVADNS